MVTIQYSKLNKKSIRIQPQKKNKNSVSKAATRGVKKKPVLKNFVGKHLQISSCEYCEILKNTFSTEHLRTTTSLVKVHRIINFRIMSKIVVNHKNKGLTRKYICFFALKTSEIFKSYSGWCLPKIYHSRQKYFQRQQ